MNFGFNFALFFLPFSRGKTGFLPCSCARMARTTRGVRRVRVFLRAKRGEKRVCCDIFGPNAAWHKLVMPLFLGGVRVFCSQEEQEEEQREEGGEEEDS